LATTIVNVYELYYGAYISSDPKRGLSAAKGYLETIDVLQLDDRSADKSGSIMANLEASGNAIDPRDLFTGCIALENEYSILTNNRKHFERLPDLLVQEPGDLVSLPLQSELIRI
jgi:predicted nucleic acid-binding protein